MIINMVGGGGGFAPSNAIVGVTAYTESTVTISNGTVTKTVTPDKSHVLSDLSSSSIYYFGIPSGMFSSSVPWNITAAYQGRQETATIIVDTNAFYDIVLTNRIPYAYQEVEYLESNGSQYIDTLIPTNSIGVLNAKLVCSNNQYGHGKNSWAFGGCTQPKISTHYAENGFGIVASGDGSLTLCIFANYWYFPEYTYDYVGDFYLSFLNDEFSFSRFSTTPTTTSIAGHSPVSCTNNFYLFTMHYSDGVNLETDNRNQFYSCEIFNHQNQKIANFIPCYRKSDSVAGMYDNVNNIFLTNQGTGTFVVGSDVNS